MSIKTNAEQPSHPNNPHALYLGLTKREYFAGQALMGLCGNGEMFKVLVLSEKAGSLPEYVIDMAREIADGLLAELEKAREKSE